MNAKLTDDAVARLPLSHGRAELLEEIMRTPVLDDRPVRTETPRRRTRWIVPVAAAAVVAAFAVGTAWWTDDTGSGPGRDGTREVAEPSPEMAGGHVLLDAPGWEVASSYADKRSGEMTYEKGPQRFDIMWGPTDSYQGYLEDRRHIVQPAADGEPITILGADAQLWPYSADDHTAIREVVKGQWIEFRGSGMDKAGYLALLDQLRLVDKPTFQASLPEEFVVDSERDATVASILDEIEAVSGQVLPPGVARSSIDSGQTDTYQLGAEVAGGVACAWLDEFAAAKQAGDQARIDAAAAVLASSHDWPVLHRMNESGDYPEVLWQYAEQASDGGVVPEGYAGGLGCALR